MYLIIFQLQRKVNYYFLFIQYYYKKKATNQIKSYWRLYILLPIRDIV